MITEDEMRDIDNALIAERAEVKRLREALERYVWKFGNCGAVYVQARKALAE
jgi:hypothetical protein